MTTLFVAILCLALGYVFGHGLRSSGPLARLSNQQASELLKPPVVKIKKLRYEAALKFGGRAEDQAMSKLLAALANATIKIQGERSA